MKKLLTTISIFLLSTILGYSQKMDQPARWGTIQGTINDQTDLINAINAGSSTGTLASGGGQHSHAGSG